MKRRDALKTMLATAFVESTRLTDSADADPPEGSAVLGLVIHSYWVRASRPLEPHFSPLKEPLAFVTHAAELGAAGVQVAIPRQDRPSLDRLRETVQQHKLYLEGIVALPKTDADIDQFESEITTAGLAGAEVVRTVCLPGRRYEVFQSLDQFNEFVKASWQALVRVEPIVTKHKMKLAVENHKDWRLGEMIGWLNRLSSEYVGVCLDTGNSIALLDEPHAVVEGLARWTMTTHLKDMGVAEYHDGFLLSEVPLGEGYLDVPRIVTAIRQARPEVRLNLEMITRDPLRVPCLTPNYWATMADVRGPQLADTLARVRNVKFSGTLPTVSQLAHAEQLHVEADNIAKCFAYAAAHRDSFS